MKTIARQELGDIVNRYNSMVPSVEHITAGEMVDIEGLVVVDCPCMTACMACDQYDECGGYNG